MQRKLFKSGIRYYATKGKDIQFGAEARAKMLEGVARLSRAVGLTLGPKGRNVVIEQTFGAPKITKDGVTVAKAIDFKDPYENLGAQLIRQVANTTNDTAGDGTTASTILAHAIFAEGYKAVTQGTSPIDMKRGIDRAVEEVIAGLKENARNISSKAEVSQVATISANGDTDIGQLIGHAMEKVGKEGVITVADGKTLDTQLEVVEGMSLDRGFISPYFVTNTKSQKVELDDVFILLSLKKISTVQHILPALEFIARSNRPLLIISDDVESEALAALIINKINGKLKVCAVKAPGFGDNKTNMLHDIAVYCGGKVIDEEIGMNIEKTFDHTLLGHAKKVSISKDQTILLTGGGEAATVAERRDLINEILRKTDSSYEREKLQERLAKLSGGVAVIKVGGASDVEVNEKKDRITDALNATRAAVAEGIVAGGGAALLYCSKRLDKLLTDPSLSDDQKTGVRIVKNAIKIPAMTIVSNAGGEGAVITHKLLADNKPTQGYDAFADKFVDMFEAGIIDPLKVVKTALVDAASVAGLMITTEAAITENPPEKGEAAAGGY